MANIACLALAITAVGGRHHQRERRRNEFGFLADRCVAARLG
jgi:hypothetical protein